MKIYGQLEANKPYVSKCVGKKIYVVSSGGELDVEINGQTDTLNSGRGLEKVEKFTEIKLLSETAQDFEIYVGFDDFIDKRISGTVNLTPSDSRSDAAQLTKTDEQFTIAARAGRKELTVQNDADSPGDVWTGSAAGKGLRLVPGASKTYRDDEGAFVMFASGTGVLINQEEVY